MKIIEWGDDYKMNVSEIDKQHEKLFALLNALGELTSKGQDFWHILKSLTNYADIHFTTEEEYLDRFNHPDSDFQKKEHAAFRKKINSFNELFASGKNNISTEIIDFLKSWLEQHIKEHDKKLGPFLNEKGVY